MNALPVNGIFGRDQWLLIVKCGVGIITHQPRMWILILILKECLKKLIMKRVSVDNKSMKNYPACNKLKNDFVNVISTITVNSEIFARVLFSRSSRMRSFLKKTLAIRGDHSAVY